MARNTQSRKPVRSAVEMAVAAVEDSPRPSPLDMDLRGIDPSPGALDLPVRGRPERCSRCGRPAVERCPECGSPLCDDCAAGDEG
jgi:hypothetical protein